MDQIRGFGFVEFESEEDCMSAIENMDGAELFGKVIHCNVAKPLQMFEAGKAAWASEAWIKSQMEAAEQLQGSEGDDDAGAQQE